MTRLPISGQDEGDWGDILNSFLLASHNKDGSLRDGSVTSTKLDATIQATLTKADSAVQTDDIRLSDARVPKAHKSSHALGGSDEIHIDASQVGSGVISTSRLGSGTASANTFLRGDQTWGSSPVSTIFYGNDSGVARPSHSGPVTWVGYSGIAPINAIENYDIVFTFTVPNSIPPSLSWTAAFWASDIVGVSDGATVAQWSDRSGNTRHATQASAGNQPTYRSSDSVFNNKPVLEFTTATKWLATPSWTADTQPNTVVIVASLPAINGAAQRIIVDGISTSERNCVARWGDGITGMYAGSVVTIRELDTSPHLIIAEFNGSSSRYIIDGITYTPSSSPGTAALSGLTIGARVSTHIDGFAGKAAFIGVLPSTISSSEISSLLDFSRNTYGTP